MENIMELNQLYNKAAREYVQKQIDNPSEHIINVAASVIKTRDKVLIGGSFVQAIINNHLEEAVCRADKECYEHLRLLVMVKKYCYPNQV